MTSLFSVESSAQTTYIDSLYSEVKNSSDSIETLYYKITSYYFVREDYNRALENAELGIKYAQEDNNLSILGELNLYEGYIFLSWGLPKKALERFAEAKKFGIITNNKRLIAGGYHGLGRSYINLSLYDKAISELKEGIKVSADTIKNISISVFYNALGMAYQEKGVLDSSLISFKTFLNLTKAKNNDSINLVFAYVNIGQIYYNLNIVDTAAYYYLLAEQLNSVVKNNQASAAIFGNKAEVFYKQNKFDSSIVYLKKSMEVCRQNNFSNFQIDNYKLLINDYKALHDSVLIISTFETLLDFKDSVSRVDKFNSINYLNAQYQIEKNIKESEILNQKLKIRSMLMYFSIAMTIVISLSLVLLYSRYKLRMKIHSQEKKELNLTIDERNRELVGKILVDNQSEMISENIANDIQSAIDADNFEDTKSILESLKSGLKRKKTNSYQWEDFKVHFQQVHPDFFNSINKVNGNLSNNELRHCAYIKMNLSTKEIANFLNVSDRAVQTARYRIKKKLNLGPEIDLFKFIQDI